MNLRCIVVCVYYPSELYVSEIQHICVLLFNYNFLYLSLFNILDGYEILPADMLAGG